MRPSVYIETTIVSYLVARPTRDVIRSAHQSLTRTWWRGRKAYSLFTSELVIEEAAAGDALAAARRKRALSGIPVLTIDENAARIAGALVAGGGLPERAGVDALHIATAAAHGMDYLLTWNCKHIANAAMRATIEAICLAEGFVPPVICTPEELPRRTAG